MNQKIMKGDVSNVKLEQLLVKIENEKCSQERDNNDSKDKYNIKALIDNQDLTQTRKGKKRDHIPTHDNILLKRD